MCELCNGILRSVAIFFYVPLSELLACTFPLCPRSLLYRGPLAGSKPPENISNQPKTRRNGNQHSRSTLVVPESGNFCTKIFRWYLRSGTKFFSHGIAQCRISHAPNPPLPPAGTCLSRGGGGSGGGGRGSRGGGATPPVRMKIKQVPASVTPWYGERAWCTAAFLSNNGELVGPRPRTHSLPGVKMRIGRLERGCAWCACVHVCVCAAGLPLTAQRYYRGVGFRVGTLLMGKFQCGQIFDAPPILVQRHQTWENPTPPTFGFLWTIGCVKLWQAQNLNITNSSEIKEEAICKEDGLTNDNSATIPGYCRH